MGWIAAHPRIAAQLVVTEDAGPGSGQERRPGLCSRSVLLILDAGQELYPRCLDVLVGTLAGDARDGVRVSDPGGDRRA